MLTSVIAQCVLFVTLRVFCENLQFRNEETPARIASIVHSLGTAFFIRAQRNLDSIATTLFALCVDWLLNTWYGKKIRLSSVLHHSAGIGLCLFSIWKRTWDPAHTWGEITMALVSMEITNPIVNLTIVCHDEYRALFEFVKIPLCALTLGAWIYYRIWTLGLAAFRLWEKTPLNTYTQWYFHCVLVLCLLQVYWLKKLFNAALRKSGTEPKSNVV